MEFIFNALEWVAAIAVFGAIIYATVILPTVELFKRDKRANNMQRNIHAIRAQAIKERAKRDRKRARARFWANEQNQMGALLLAVAFGGFVMWAILAF